MIATTADRSIAIGDVLDVGVFTFEQAVAYLEDGTALADPDGASRVAVELGRLPLALAGAVWTIARRRRLDHSYGYGHYVEELERQPLERLLGSDKATPEYPRATVAALSLAIEAAMDAAVDRELARSVLGSLAFLDPQWCAAPLVRRTGRTIRRRRCPSSSSPTAASRSPPTTQQA